MNRNPIYFDYNATCPIRPEVMTAVTNAMATGGNASSVHAPGRAARKMIEDARAQVAALVGATAKQVIFNSGATEGNNTVLRFYADQRILIGATEHSSVIQTGTMLNAEKIPVTPGGIIDLAAFEDMCKNGPAPALVSVMYVNNETGVINPVADVARIAHQYGAAAHCDAVQAAGKINIDMRTLDVDFLTISAHKIGGPQGVGALIIADGSRVCYPTPVLLTGGGQEQSWRAGTENVAGIVGFGVAATLCHPGNAAGIIRDLPPQEPQKIPAQATLVRDDTILDLRDQLENILITSTDRIKIHGRNAPRVANTICFTLDGVSAETMLMNMDLGGVYLSSGSACSSGKVKPSHVLLAMGVAPDLAKCGLRISIGYTTTQDEIDAFQKIWHDTIKRITR